MSTSRVTIDEMIAEIDREAGRQEGMCERFEAAGAPFNGSVLRRRAQVFRAIESGLIDIRNRQQQARADR